MRKEKKIDEYIYTLKISEKRTCANVNVIIRHGRKSANTKKEREFESIIEINFYVKSIQQNNAAQQLR